MCWLEYKKNVVACQTKKLKDVKEGFGPVLRVGQFLQTGKSFFGFPKSPGDIVPNPIVEKMRFILPFLMGRIKKNETEK